MICFCMLLHTFITLHKLACFLHVFFFIYLFHITVHMLFLQLMMKQICFRVENYVKKQYLFIHQFIYLLIY